MKKLIAGLVFLTFFSALAFCEEASDTQIRLEGISFTVSPLPSDWKKIEMPQGESKLPVGAAFTAKNPKRVFHIDTNNIGDNPFYLTREYQVKFLDETKAGLKEQYGEQEWLSGESIEIFGLPAIAITTVNDKNKSRSIYFLKGYAFCEVGFICEKDRFDEQWPAIEKTIESINFI